MATIPIQQPIHASSAAPPIPPLEQGDHLTRDEFHRRYEAMPHLNKAELIDGVVHMPSPVNHKKHGKPHFDSIGWLSHYVAQTPGMEGGDNGTLKLDLKNEPQPDAFLLIPPALGGRVQFDDQDYIIGGPELINEIAASSASYDLHTKLEAYRRNNVKEYVVWRVLDRAIGWLVLDGSQYHRLSLNADGWYQSRVFPGLWLDPAALLNGDLLRVFAVVQHGVASKEHQDFVTFLKSR